MFQFCVCDHEKDEHDNGRECLIGGCDCIHFELDVEVDDEDLA